MHRRSLILAVPALCLAPMARAEAFEVTLTEAEWRAKLDPLGYRVLREGATERPGTSRLNDEDRTGTYHCLGCDLPAFASAAKYDSGTGWPSFREPLPDAVRTRAEWGMLGARTEVHCRRCGGHFGHVFTDGPPPTGLRYCLNGAALTFRPA
jgi:peptide-methionine (R)-S-oxide reductase